MLINTNLVSVLIRTFNRPVTLAKAIDSVLQQTHRPLEIIVVNDGGEAPDAALEVLANEQQVALTLVNLTENQGRSNAANVALKKAAGAALMFLDDDDWVDPSHVAKLLPVLQGNSELIAVYSDTACVFSASNSEVLKVFDYEFDPQRLVYESYLPIHSVLFKNNELSQVCQFDTRLDMYEDWNFWVQLAAKGQMQRVQGVTAWYSAQLSGMGIGLESQDYSVELAKFFRLTMPFYTDQQINALLSMCWSFFSISQANKHKESVIAALQLELDRSRQREQLELATSRQREQEYAAMYEQQYAAIHEQQYAIIKEELSSLATSLSNTTLLLQQKKGVAAWYAKARQTLAKVPLLSKIKRKTRTLLQLVMTGDLQGIKIRLMRNIDSVLKKILRRS